MTIDPAAKRPNRPARPATTGLKVLVTVLALTGTIGGWAMLSRKEALMATATAPTPGVGTTATATVESPPGGDQPVQTLRRVSPPTARRTARPLIITRSSR